MNKVKLYGVLSILLLCLNLFLIWFFIAHNPQRIKERDPREVFTEKLHFDANQKEEFDKLIKWHRGNINVSENKIKSLKEQLYSCLQSDNNTSLADSLIVELGKEHEHIEVIHYKHFSDIKKMCKPDQLTDFYKLTNDLAKLFGPRPLRNEKH